MITTQYTLYYTVIDTKLETQTWVNYGSAKASTDKMATVMMVMMVMMVMVVVMVVMVVMVMMVIVMTT